MDETPAGLPAPHFYTASFIGSASMANVDHIDESIPVVDRVNHSSVSDAEPPAFRLAFQFLHA
jgi:hypothetical protein